MTGRPPAQIPEKKTRRSLKWTGRTRGGYLGHYVFIVLLERLGLRAAYCLLVPVAFYFVFFAPRAIKASLVYLKHVLGGSLLRRLPQSYLHLFRFGQVLIDRFAFNIHPERFEVDHEGIEHIEEALRQGNGLVMVSAHVGAWESGARALSHMQYPINVVMFDGEVPKVRELMEKAQGAAELRLIGVKGSYEDTLEIVAALRRGEIVAMHGDRDFGGNTVTLPFFGGAARFPVGPYLVAAVARAPLVVTLSARTAAYRYRFVATPPIYPRFGSRSERRHCLADWSGQYVLALESWLRTYPFQWFNFFPFWCDGDALEVRENARAREEDLTSTSGTKTR